MTKSYDNYLYDPEMNIDDVQYARGGQRMSVRGTVVNVNFKNINIIYYYIT